MTRPTPSMLSALKWLVYRNFDGVFDKNGVLIACGEKAPVMRATWNKLEACGLVEFHMNRKRLKVTDAGMKIDLSKVEESKPRW